MNRIYSTFFIIFIISFPLHTETALPVSVEKKTASNQLSSIDLIQKRTKQSLLLNHVNSFSIKKSNLELFASGYWKSTAGGTINFNINKNYTQFSFKPFFTQSGNFSLWLLINKQWYFETEVFDDLVNSIAAFGYFGTSNSPIRHIRIGNSGITFPSRYPFIQIGGGKQINPGIMAAFSGKSWMADIVLRYDSGEYRQKVFYGNTERQEIHIPISQWSKSMYFYIPGVTNTNNLLQVYIKKKKSWIELDQADYTFDQKNNTLSLHTAAPNGVAVFAPVLFNGGTMNATLENHIHTLKDPINSCEEIAAIIKPPNDSSYYETIHGVTCLVIKQKDVFSPFEIASRYNIDSKIQTAIFIRNTATKQKESRYIIKQTHNTLINKNLQNIRYIEVAPTNNSSTIKKLLPFSSDSPEIYVLQKEKKNAHHEIMYYQYIPAPTFYLSQNAQPGTINVYRNDIPEFAFTYNEQTHTVTLTQQPAKNEKIRITWITSNPYKKQGSVTAGIGGQWTPITGLDMSIGAGLQWSPNTKGVSSYTDKAGGTFILSSGLSYKYEGLDVGTKAAFYLQKGDVKQIHAISSMNKDEADFFLDNPPYTDLTIQSDYFVSLDSQALSKNNPVVNQINAGNKNHCAKITIKNTTHASLTHDITIAKNFNTAAFNEYKSVSFFIKDSDSNRLFSTALGKMYISFFNENNLVLESVIFDQSIIKNNIWNKITIDLQKKTISVNNVNLSKTQGKVTFYDNTTGANIFKIKVTDSTFTNNEKKIFFFDELFLEESILTSTFKSNSFINYKKGKILSSKNNIPIFSNLSIFCNTDIVKKQNSSFPAIHGEIDSSIDVWRIHLNAGLSLRDAFKKKSPVIESYYHNIIIPIFYFTASELFFINQYTKKLNRENTLHLNYYLDLFYQTSILYENTSVIQEYSASITPRIPKTKAGIFYIKTAISLVQEYEIKNSPSLKGYTKAWSESLQNAYSAGNSDARYRNENLKFFFSWTNTEKKTPFFVEKINFSATTKSHYSHTGIREKAEITNYTFNMPIVLDLFVLNIHSEREAIYTKKNTASSNYKEDLYELFSGIAVQSWIFTSPHIYDLFDPSLTKKIQGKHSNTDQFVFSNLYKLTIKRNFFNSIHDSYIPTAVNAEIKRMTYSKPALHHSADNYQFLFSLKYTALNLFSSYGLYGLPQSYKYDEFNRTYSLEILSGNNYTYYTFNSFHHFSFTLNDNKNISIKNMFFIKVKKDPSHTRIDGWKNKTVASFSWNEGASLTEIIIRKFSDIPLKNTRTSSVSLELITLAAQNHPAVTVEFTHDQKTSIGQHGEIRLFANLSVSFLHATTNVSLGGGISGQINY